MDGNWILRVSGAGHSLLLAFILRKNRHSELTRTVSLAQAKAICNTINCLVIISSTTKTYVHENY